MGLGGYVRPQMCHLEGFEEISNLFSCCIDKSSSAELSEAINSMFRWYRDAEVCYAYLCDVPNAPPSSGEAWDHIKKSKWFTRGWTLQELVAPKDLRFYSEDWHHLGTKAQFADMISKMTKIGTRFLFGDNLDLASIAQKMSWAAHRHTTRLEDQAYSLLGIFDINIPLLYGEGSQAFQRLQHTLLTTYPEDQAYLCGAKSSTAMSKTPQSWIAASSTLGRCLGDLPAQAQHFMAFLRGRRPTLPTPSTSSHAVPLPSAFITTQVIEHNFHHWQAMAQSRPTSPGPQTSHPSSPS